MAKNKKAVILNVDQDFSAERKKQIETIDVQFNAFKSLIPKNSPAFIQVKQPLANDFLLKTVVPQCNALVDHFQVYIKHINSRMQAWRNQEGYLDDLENLLSTATTKLVSMATQIDTYQAAINHRMDLIDPDDIQDKHLLTA